MLISNAYVNVQHLFELWTDHRFVSRDLNEVTEEWPRYSTGPELVLFRFPAGNRGAPRIAPFSTLERSGCTVVPSQVWTFQRISSEA